MSISPVYDISNVAFAFFSYICSDSSILLYFSFVCLFVYVCGCRMRLVLVCVFVCIDWQKWRARTVHSSRIACLLMKVCEYSSTPTLQTPSLQPQQGLCVFCVYTLSS